MDEVKSFPCARVRDLLPDWVAGRLGEGEAAAVRAHLEGCAGCREEAGVVDSLYRGRPRAPVPPVEALRVRVPTRDRRRRWLLPAAAAAALAALLIRGELRERAGGGEAEAEAEVLPRTWRFADGIVAGEPVLDELSENVLLALLTEMER